MLFNVFFIVMESFGAVRLDTECDRGFGLWPRLNADFYCVARRRWGGSCESLPSLPSALFRCIFHGNSCRLPQQCGVFIAAGVCLIEDCQITSQSGGGGGLYIAARIMVGEGEGFPAPLVLQLPAGSLRCREKWVWRGLMWTRLLSIFIQGYHFLECQGIWLRSGKRPPKSGNLCSQGNVMCW